MKTLHFLPAITLLVWFAACDSLLARTFTDTKGREVEAKLLSVKGNKAELKIASTGKTVMFPISRLSKADQEYIKLWLEVGGSDKKEDKDADADEKDKEDKKEMTEEEKRREAIRKLLDKEKPDPLNLDSIVLDSSLWSMAVTDFQKKYKKNGFVFMSAAKTSVRSEGEGFTLFDKPAGEVVIRSQSGKITHMNISVYNRGDDDQIGFSVFNDTHRHLIQELNEKIGTEGQQDERAGAVDLVTTKWAWKDSILILEKSMGADKKTPEFMRIKLKSKNARSEGMANRSELNQNVTKDRESGDVCITGVPMIDQGQKGYCAVASAARVYRYYGLDIGQHELAQIAGTGPDSGTSLGAMVASLKKVTRHVRSRVLVLYEYPKGLADKDPDMDTNGQEWDRIIRNYNLGLKEYARDIKNYNRIAEKRGKKTFADDFDKGVVNMMQFASECDPEIYRDVMTKKSSFRRFSSKIKEYVDQGIPVGWCLQLGMFKEGDMPQSFGGHMRLIIGYNEKTKEIIYTDSWGAGHEKKRMPIGNAFCMSTALLVMPPNK